MTDTAQRIMGLFLAHGAIEPGAVLIISELRRRAADWGALHSASLEAAMEELKTEGYVIITAPHGLELTARGVSYLLAD
jgi:hypothetical protein